ncbi:MAG: hypothetical protein WBF53_02860 [Litorimonas sp.]
MRDLEYATQIARKAENSPLIGGPIGLMWTSLATLALLIHGAILAQWISVDASLTGLVWLVYGVVGTGLSVMLSRRFTAVYGTRSLANRVAEACWVSMGVMTALIAVTTVVAFMLRRVDMLAFNFIVPFAFALSAAAYGVLARLTGYGYLKYAAIASGLSTAVTLFLVREPSMYFVAGLLLFLSGVIPSIIELRREAE